MKAHMLVPKNSHICSLLSLVSFYQKNYLESIYYSIISYEYDIIHDRCSNRFLSKFIRIKSNRQNLLVYFDTIRTIHTKMLTIINNDYEQINEIKIKQRKRIERCNNRINKYYRIEYWIKPNNNNNNDNRQISKCDMYNFYDLAAINDLNETNLLKFYENFILKKSSSTSSTTLMINKSQFKQLKDRFIYSFLMIHAMLNYRNGLDHFYDIANQMILEFNHLINNDDDDNRLSSFFLLQLFVINMYSVANTMDDNQYNISNNGNNRDYFQYSLHYSFTQKNSYFIMSLMISIILKRLIKLFDLFYNNYHMNYLQQTTTATIAKLKIKKLPNEPTCIDDIFGSIHQTIINDKKNTKIEKEWYEFYTYLPCIKLWSDWCISFNPYFPPQEMNDIQTPGIEENVWQIFAQFLTKLHKLKQYPVIFFTDRKNRNNFSFSSPNLSDSNDLNEYELVQLPEDKCLDGFKILNDIPESSKFVHQPFTPEIAYIYMRIESIKLFGDYLCGLQYPYLKFDTKTLTFESLINIDDVENQPGVKLKQIQQKQLLDAMMKQDINGNDNDKNDQHDDEDDDECYSNDEEAIEEINNLKLNPIERRKLLQYRWFRKQNRQHGKYFRNIMIEQKNEKKRRFIIKPKYIVFDTNCLINDLNTIMKFLNINNNDDNEKNLYYDKFKFIITIPLIVIQELQSMMIRGQKYNDDDNCQNNNKNDEKELKIKQLSMKSNEILEQLQKAFNMNNDNDNGNGNVVNIKTITSKGSLLDRIDYKEEFYNNDKNSDAINNDDLILYGCVNLVEKNSIYNDDDNNINDNDNDKWMKTLLINAGEKYLSTQDEYIYRNVVLITDDMNLRIKSLAYDIPVKKFKQFKKWIHTSLE